MAYATDNLIATIPFADRFNAFIENRQAIRAKRRVYKRTYTELEALTNKELADIGINRSMIKTVALAAAEEN